MSLSYDELIRIEQAVGERQGWDFSKVRDGRDPVPWDYPQVVRQYLKQTDTVLDVGTGGGETFLSLASSFARGHGVDASPEMIEVANSNATDEQYSHIAFSVMDANDLDFESQSFDVVLNRHSVVNVDEVIRILRPNGYFITQSVGHQNTQNIFSAFGWTFADFGDESWLTTREIANLFQQQGANIRTYAEYDVPYWFEDVESLVFWLKAVPLPEPFDMTKHWQHVNQIIDICSTSRGIETNEHRELLIVQT